MIVKILSSASKDFSGVRYNDKKINSGKGELMMMKNFPSFINSESTQQEVRDYFKAISKSNKVKKPQFHAIISTKFQEHSKEELTDIADDFMQKMGYKNQPYILVFHKDTENNHIHIVSTRVDKNTGKKIDDSFEKLKSQKVLSEVMKNRYGIDKSKRLEKLLKYRFSNIQQLEKLLDRNGFKLKINENSIEIFHNGVAQKTLHSDEISYSNHQKDARSKQIKAILERYKLVYSNKVFKVIDDRDEKGLGEKYRAENKNKSPKIQYESQLQYQLRQKFGIDIVFHFKDEKLPFGYTLIDNATQTIYKGSDVLAMKSLFEFTSEAIDKKSFEQLKDYKVTTEKEKQILLSLFEKKGISVKDFMIFQGENTTEKRKNFDQVQQEINEHINKNENEFISVENDNEQEAYAVHQRYHQVHKLEEITQKKTEKGIVQDIAKIFTELGKVTYVGRDRTEDEFKKRKKKKRK